MIERRKEPYVWATWVPPLLVNGDSEQLSNPCQWKAWFKAHHYYEKLPSDFDRDGWLIVHGKLVQEHVERLRIAGYRVTVEEQNRFKLSGNNGTVLSGKPDIVAVNGNRVLVIDCKSGEQRPWHRFQVMLYMLCLPHANKAYKGMEIEGRVQYLETSFDIPGSSLDEPFKTRFRQVMDTISSVSAPPQSPSTPECAFCDISGLYCSARIEPAPGIVIPAVDLF
jgi:hypothetical protein